MSRRGPTNLDSDTAYDYFTTEILQPLEDKLREIIADPTLAEPDDPTADEVMVAVDVLCVLCKSFDLLPPEPALVEACAKTYLKVWDNYIKRMKPERTSETEWEEYKQARRSVIRSSFDRLIALSHKRHKDIAF